MKHIFLVKKNPALPGSDDNWIYMNYQQYQRFLNTPEGRERKNNFAQIDRVSRRDVLYTIEGDSDVVKKIMVEKDAHDYREKSKVKSGYTVCSYSAVYDSVLEILGEELIVDESANVERIVIHKLLLEAVKECYMELSEEDRHMLDHLYDDPQMSIEEYADLVGLPVHVVKYQKKSILSSLKCMLNTQYGIGRYPND